MGKGLEWSELGGQSQWTSLDPFSGAPPSGASASSHHSSKTRYHPLHGEISHLMGHENFEATPLPSSSASDDLDPTTCQMIAQIRKHLPGRPTWLRDQQVVTTLLQRVTSVPAPPPYDVQLATEALERQLQEMDQTFLWTIKLSQSARQVMETQQQLLNIVPGQQSALSVGEGVSSEPTER